VSERSISAVSSPRVSRCCSLPPCGGGLGWGVTTCAALVLSVSVARAENWPQWRGPNNDGVSGETNVPVEWSETKHIVWKLPLPGTSGATPAVWGQSIFLTSEDKGEVVLLCVGTDGHERWKRRLGSGERRFMRDEANQASPSPSTDGKHVYAFTGAGDFVAFDFDGKEIWRFNAQERYGRFKIQFGMHVTPLLYGDRLYLALLHSGGWWVIALDKATGKEVWKVRRESDAKRECEQSYASPCIWHNGSEEYLIVHGCDYATAHRLTDGSEVWRLGDLNPETKYNGTLRFVASPVAVSDLVVVPSAKNGPVVGVKPDAKGKITAGSAYEQWRRPNNTPDVPSPLVHDGLVYLCRENGILICMDAKTGKEHYQERLHPRRYRASPVYADGKIYCTARDGTVTVVKAGSVFQQLAVNKLPDEIAASTVISNGRIYLRGFNALYAIGQSPQ
jgi:outer membrane protein assembly factor BamB